MLRASLVIVAVAVAVLCSIGISCKKDNPVQPTPPGHTAISLQATFTSIRWCRLQWSNDSNAASHHYILIRDNRDTLFDDTVGLHDAVKVWQDTALMPGTAYNYLVFRIVDGKHWDSAMVNVRTLDTSRDELSWVTQRFGLPGSSFYGVWGQSPRSIWVAGGGIDDSGNTFQVVHVANGRFYGLYADLGGAFYGVCGISDTMMWFSGENVLSEWNGHQFTNHVFDGDSLPNYNTTFYAVWVTPDGRDVYAIGDRGLILHGTPDGKWEKMESGTSLRLLTILGFSSHEIYVSGSDAIHEGVVLVFNGTVWKELVHSFYPVSSDTSKPVGPLVTIGGESGDSLYNVGGFIYKREGDHWIRPAAPCNDPAGAAGCGGFRQAVGGQWNNVWVSGAFGDLLHFSGERWTRLLQFYDRSSDLVLPALRVFPNDVFIVGTDHTSAVLIHGR
jgi:hypothetical protein